jgi:hypothetical protein
VTEDLTATIPSPATPVATADPATPPAATV